MEYKILKNNQTELNYDEYNDIIKKNKLFLKNKKENKRLIREKENKELFNLSLNQIAKNFSNHFIHMLNDMVNLVDKYLINPSYTNNDSFMNDLFLIFIRDERLIYSGIFFILFSFFLYFMDISS